ncbi:hypothetical protein HPP92_000165 [Vanilla planifolia]|uniref:Uncharacterized protein n=1 Tax=Vanilla planifolia TaxID=51239 RepID=A0A835VKA0_VANPL|nr:hypothetical protein HPP92_000165 [Vanilla planifolia]
MRNHDSFSNIYQKRVMYARSLIEMLGLAKQRNKLMCIKLKKLQNEAETFQTKVEECSKLKSMYSRLHIFSKRAIGLHELCGSRQQEEHNKILALKQELQMLEQRSKLLLQQFESSCKLKGKMSCDGIIEVINEHLLRRNFCMEIQQCTQQWKFSDIMAKNDHYEIVLNYCNLLFQRFILSKNQVSSIVTKSICNAENIEKKYPNTNAHIAFEFVFKLDVEHKISASKGIYMETVGTNLRLGTLVDVLQEIFLSRLELMNLLSSTFVMRSCELELQLHFYGSNYGRKFVCGIDLTSLNHGVYPEDPSEMKLRVDEQQTTLPSPMVDRVISAVRSLQGGHLVILRLCRCVSQLIHNSS